MGCIDFLREMYDNNKTLLFNYDDVRKLIKEICNSINAEPEGSYYKVQSGDSLSARRHAAAPISAEIVSAAVRWEFIGAIATLNPS